MKSPADGWDRDERDALEPLEDELDSIHAVSEQVYTLARAAAPPVVSRSMRKINRTMALASGG